MKLKYYFTLLSLLSFMACSDDSPSTPDTPDQPDVPNSVEKLVTINAGKTYQTITGFGASDCWNPSYVVIVAGLKCLQRNPSLRIQSL